MPVIVAIQPDNYGQNPADSDACSPRWAAALERRGFEIRWVDVRRPDILDQLAGCRALMWRWVHYRGMARIARRLLPVLERDLGLLLYPDQDTCWHYDDKIAQTYLFQAFNIPHPKTWVWFDRNAALAWLRTAPYPLVMKLSSGAGASNVVRIDNYAQASRLTRRMFAGFAISLRDGIFRRWRLGLKALAMGHQILDKGYEPQAGYVYFQEFLSGNDWDTRAVVIGGRAFVYRRFNRPNDFRASGSGNRDYDRQNVDPRFIHLAFDLAARLKMQTCVMDLLYRGQKQECVVGEVSYTTPSIAVKNCPGYWRRNDGQLEWHEQPMWPEEAQIEDFVQRLTS